MHQAPDSDDFLNVSRLNFEGDVEEQVASLLEHVRLSRGEVVDLRNLLADLEYTLRNIWPDCEVHPFGSIITGLGIRSSDVDVYVRVPRSIQNRFNPVISARNILKNTPRKFAKVFAIPSAKVPIVKFIYKPTGCNCDVNFKSESGVRNSKLIFHLLRMDPNALSLAILVKYWSKVYGLTGTNLLPNYALTLLVIFYLQEVYILSPVSELQKTVKPFMVDGWNTAFDKNAPHPKACQDNIYHLLGGFFKYYSSFQFDQLVVSTYLGTPVTRTLFGNFNPSLINEFEFYKENLRTEFCKPLQIDKVLCIQDPFEHSRNCAGAVSPKLFAKIQMHLQYAARMYEQKPPNEFLKALLTQPSPNQAMVIDRNQYKHAIHTIIHNNKQKKKKKFNNITKKYAELQKNWKKADASKST